MDTDEAAELAAASARAGASVAADQFRTPLNVERKAGDEAVTAVDRAAQTAVVDRLRETAPGAAIVGEEVGTIDAVPADGTAWIVDPIDGTSNYVRENRRWTTSVARIEAGEPTAAANVLPAMGDSYLGRPGAVTRNDEPATVSDRTDPRRFAVTPIVWWGFDRREEYTAAVRAILGRFGDLRRVGSAQAALSLVATGGLDGAVTNVAASPWDTVAGAAMVEWAGGRVTDLAGEPWRYDSRGLVASNGHAHEAVLAAAQEIDHAARADSA